jgi:dihydropteroate synthase
MMMDYKISWGNHVLALGKRTCVMGILNVTPDSFSDGGVFFDCDAAVAHGLKMVEDGADIIDIGGESTRPFSISVSSEEEIKRVVPVIEKLAQRIHIPISIDTTKATVAKAAIKAGASIINDISALRYDQDMAKIAADYGVPVILMHMQGTPETMQVAPGYDNLLEDIKQFLEGAIAVAENNGILRSKIIIDPGIGFGKTVQHNLLIIKQLNELKLLNVPVLVGLSRKAFIQHILKDKKTKENGVGFSLVETGTQAALVMAVMNGAHIVRVHNVVDTVATLKIIEAVRSA